MQGIVKDMGALDAAAIGINRFRNVVFDGRKSRACGGCVCADFERRG